MLHFSENNQELTPIDYNPAAIKILKFSIPEGKDCFRIHWHDRMEVLRLHEGEMYVTHGANVTKLHSGEMILLPPKIPHYAHAGQGELLYDVLMFDVRSFYNDSDICKTYLPAIYNGRAKFNPVISHAETIRSFDQIIENEDCGSLEIISYIYLFLYQLFRHNLLELHTGMDGNEIVRRIVEYIDKNFAEDLTTATLCSRFGYTAAHFCRKFKEWTGLTPMNFLKIRRMEEAYKLLKKGHHNINEIAMHCGYTDANYFTRCFKSHFGIPPSQLK